jgi:hypothetical protein
MLQESNPSRNSTYLVPCVLKAVHMIETLRKTSAGLRVENLRGMTGYPRTTIYRILRTLVACGYIVRNSGGVYRLNRSPIDAEGRSADAGDGGKSVLDARRPLPAAAARRFVAPELPQSTSQAFEQ